MQLLRLSKIALIALISVALPNLSKGQDIATRQQLEFTEKAKTAPVTELYERIMSANQKECAQALIALCFLKALGQDDQAMNTKDMQNAMEFLHIAIGVLWTKEELDRAKDRLRVAQESGNKTKTKEAQKYLNQRQQQLLEMQETLKKLANEIDAQAKQ